MKNLILFLLLAVLSGFAMTMTDSKSVDIGDDVSQYIKMLDQENYQSSIQFLSVDPIQIQSEQHKKISFIAYRYKPLTTNSVTTSNRLYDKIMVNNRLFEVGWQS